MRILVIADDIWHPAEVIRMGLAAFPDKNVTFDMVCTAKDILTPELLAAYPLVMICKGDCINAANSAPWFEDGVTNVSVNCIDRHLEKRGDQVAIIWEGDDPSESKRITYRELHAEVCRMANVLRNRGVEKGSTVTIYMPMIPEAAYAMLFGRPLGNKPS